MLFTSFDFVFFFLFVLAAYWALRRRLRVQNIFLLGASYFFYGYWDIRFLYLIVVSTAVDFCCAQIIDRGHIKAKDKIKVSCFVLISALLFVVPDFNAIDNNHNGFTNLIHADWSPVFSNGFGWSVFLWSTAVLVILNVCYPLVNRTSTHSRRKIFVLASIATNLTLLGIFKYFNFFADTFKTFSESVFGVTPHWYTLDIILPVGISFYTFQTISYTIDVYRGHLPASKKLSEFAAYVAFFPQLVAGPIERGKHLLPQFQKSRSKPAYADIQEGSWLIFWGLFKKLVIADNLAIIVNSTFAPFDNLTAGTVTPEDGFRLLIAVYAFAFQIYCDFSGYTDIARGTAKLLGFDIMINFRLPYFSTGPSEFWRRWHISLSSWLRDYLYIPLGGNRKGKFRMYRNLTLTMLLGGLWHGASWTFVIWGAYHGLLLSIYRFFNIKDEFDEVISWKKALMIVLFFQLTCVGWLIFRASNVDTIVIFLESIFLNPTWSEQAWFDIKQLCFYVWFLILFQIVQYWTNNLNPMQSWHWFVRLNVWIYIIMSLLVLTSNNRPEFIYFAF